MSNHYDKAIEVLQTQGWTSRDYHRHGKYCAVGALAIAMKGFLADDMEVLHEDVEDAGAFAGRILARDILVKDDVTERDLWWDADADTLVAWNDAPGRTVDDVIHLFKLASQEFDLAAEKAATG